MRKAISESLAALSELLLLAKKWTVILWHSASNWGWFACFFLGGWGLVSTDEFALAWLLFIVSAFSLISKIWHANFRVSAQLFFSLVVLVICGLCCLTVSFIEGEKSLSHASQVWDSATLLFELRKVPDPPPRVFPPASLPDSPRIRVPRTEEDGGADFAKFKVRYKSIELPILDETGAYVLPVWFVSSGDRTIHLYASEWTFAVTYPQGKPMWTGESEKEKEENFWKKFEERERQKKPISKGFRMALPPNQPLRALLPLGNISAYMAELKAKNGEIYVAIRLRNDAEKVVSETCVIVDLSGWSHLCYEHNLP